MTKLEAAIIVLICFLPGLACLGGMIAALWR